jgi:predicted nucleic acid-binding protein
MAGQWAYFDTSVLVKRYVKERGSRRARVLLRRHRFLSSAIAPLEVISALVRRRSAGELTKRDFSAILSRLRGDRDYWEVVQVSPLVLERGEGLIRTTGLRSLDAIHVASALVFQAGSGIRIPFVTGDTVQREAAREMGLDVVWIP